MVSLFSRLMPVDIQYMDSNIICHDWISVLCFMHHMLIWMFKSMYFCFAWMLYCTFIEPVCLSLACILLSWDTSKHCFPFPIFYLFFYLLLMFSILTHSIKPTLKTPCLASSVCWYLSICPHHTQKMSLPKSSFKLWHFLLNCIEVIVLFSFLQWSCNKW